MKPLQVDVLWPEPDEHIVRGFKPIKVASFKYGVNYTKMLTWYRVVLRIFKNKIYHMEA